MSHENIMDKIDKKCKEEIKQLKEQLAKETDPVKRKFFSILLSQYGDIDKSLEEMK